MPKYNFMVSKAVDLVARKLAGMDTDTIVRLSQVLSEEAQMISEELQYSGEKVDSDILAARLEGVVSRMKHEARNMGPDPSPHEFPIFNVSHNPSSPYPNPINHLYDKRYKEAYSTFITQNQATEKAKTSTPALPAPAPAPPSTPSATSNSSSHSNYSHAQHQQKPNQQSSHSRGYLPPGSQQQTNNYQYINPTAMMTHPHNAYYQQHGSQIIQPSQNNTQPIRRSSTADDLRPNSISRSASTNELSYSPSSGKEQIRVRVINDNSVSSIGDLQTGAHSKYSQRSPMKAATSSNGNTDMTPTRTIYASPSTELNKETMEDIMKVVNRQQSENMQSTGSPMAERIIIIDRRGSSAPDDKTNPSSKNRFRTYEVRTTPTNVTPSPVPATPSTPTTPTTTTLPTAYVPQHQNYYTGQQLFYQQPRMYSTTPQNIYMTASPYVPRTNGYYQFGYYPY